MSRARTIQILSPWDDLRDRLSVIVRKMNERFAGNHADVADQALRHPKVFKRLAELLLEAEYSRARGGRPEDRRDRTTR